MAKHTGIVLSALTLCLGGSVHAATLASAPNYGGVTIANSGGTVTCRLFNAGSGTAQITTRQIIANSGAAITPTANTCASSLALNTACEFSAPIPGNLALSCRVTYNGTGAALRGVTEVTDIAGDILNDVLMQ